MARNSIPCPVAGSTGSAAASRSASTRSPTPPEAHRQRGAHPYGDITGPFRLWRIQNGEVTTVSQMSADDVNKLKAEIAK
jgi:hypothetical protein